MKEEKDLKTEETKQSGEVSRRDFLVGAGTVVVGGAVGAGLLSSCNGGEDKTVTTTKTVEKTVTVDGGGGGATVTVTETVGGEGAITITETKTVSDGTGGGALEPWQEPETTIVASHIHVVACDVKNGRIVRGRRVHFEDDVEAWSLSARGKTWTVPLKSTAPAYYLAHRKRTDSPNRIPYPLKRVDWEPGGDPAKINAQNRGRSKYKRISWDEAATIIAGEMVRVADKYGVEAVSSCRSGHHHEGHNVQGSIDTINAFMYYWSLAKYGSTTTDRHDQANSTAGGQMGGRYVLGTDYEPNDVLKDICENTELMLVWPGDVGSKTWRYTIGQLPGMWYHWFEELGIKRVFISPDLNLGASLYADKWIPLIPQTDAAFMLAIAHIWFKEGTFDQSYLDTHTVGFEKFKAYVLGEEDGEEKTVDWAAPICGVDKWTIKAVARAWASKITSIGYGRAGGGAVCRTVYAHEAQRIQLYLQAMQGLGAPGKHTLHAFGQVIGKPVKPATTNSVGGSAKITSLIASDLGHRLNANDRDRQFIPTGKLEKAILNPPVYYYSMADQFFKRRYPMEGKSEIHFMWQPGASWTGSDQNGHGCQRAMQSPKLECIVSQMMWLEDGISYSDIILPICSAEEHPDINVISGSNFEVMTCYTEPIVKPFGESKSDLEAVLLVGEKLGVTDSLTGGKKYDELIQDRIKEGYNNSGVTDLISWDKLSEKTYFAQAPDMKWYNREPTFLGFYKDPNKNPLRTPTGLLEIESQLLKDNFPDDKERPPVARYVRGGPPEEGWAHNEDRLISERAKHYPLLMVSNTSTWKHHSMFSDVPWTREIEKVVGYDGYAYSPIWVNPVDADARGIKEGDIIRVFNERGGVLGGAILTDRVIAGAVRMEKAGGGHHIIPGELHRGGNPNCINPVENHSLNAYGGAYTGYLVEVERVTGSQMDEWRANYPEAFARDSNPTYGEFCSGWIIGKGGE
ncbi:MAG: molybdopterin-dependent oxidoreductase [Dehalococcoidales bacterium]